MVRLAVRGEGGSPHSLTVKRSFYEFHQQNMSIATNNKQKKAKHGKDIRSVTNKYQAVKQD